MKTKKILLNNEGSALILATIVLVTAIIIATSISVISVMEKKISGRTKSSTPAFQAADSGIEWAMKEIDRAELTDTIESVFEEYYTGDEGEIWRDDANERKFTIYLIKKEIVGTQQDPEVDSSVITDFNTVIIGDVKAIRSVGKHGKEDVQEVVRALEALATSNCPVGYKGIGDFCIISEPGGRETWEHTTYHNSMSGVTGCVQRGDRLCSLSELVMACQSEELEGSDDLWTGDLVIDENRAILMNANDCSISSDTLDMEYNYYCCRNR